MNKIFTLISLLFSCATLLAQDATSIFKDRVGSTVIIITADNEGNPISQGSGFFIDKNLVATSHHVVAGTKQAIIKTPDGKYELYEVKSGTSIKEENYDDVTFQRIVLSNTNYVVSNVFLVYVNTDYMLEEELDVDTYFIIEDVTAIAKERTPQTKLNIASAINYLNTEPVFKLIDLCSERLNCAFALFSGVTEPAYSVFNIARLHSNKLYELLQMGIVDIMDIPQNFKLSSKQQQQINIAQNNTTYIDKEAINAAIPQVSFSI